MPTWTTTDRLLTQGIEITMIIRRQISDGIPPGPNAGDAIHTPPPLPEVGFRAPDRSRPSTRAARGRAGEIHSEETGA